MSLASKGYVTSVACEGGGGGSSKGVFVGTVTKGSTFPTKRLDGSDLQIEDFVKVDGNTPAEDFPFIIKGVEFKTRKDLGIFLGGSRWSLDPGIVQDTNETPTTNKDAESLNGQGSTQAQVNSQVADAIGKKKTIDVDDKDNIIDAINYIWEECKKAGYTFTLDHSDTNSIRDISFTIKDKDNNILLDKTLNGFVLKTRKIADKDLSDDITPQDIQNAIKDLTVTLTNKSMDAEDNTFTNFDTSTFKSDAKSTSTDPIRNLTNSVDTKFTTEKFIQKVLQNIFDPTQDSHAANKKYVDDAIAILKGKVMEFKGFISPTEPVGPTGTIKEGHIWHESSTIPKTFPINVKTYDGEEWSSETTEYTPNTLDLWSDLNSGNGYYWFGTSWNLIDETIEVDNITIEKDIDGILRLKFRTTADKGKTLIIQSDGSWDIGIINSWLPVPTFVGVTPDENTLYILYNNVTIDNDEYKKGFYTWNATDGYVARSSVVEVDDVTITKDSNGKLIVKDKGITNDKLDDDIRIGSLNDLKTTKKDNVVNAINELESDKQEKEWKYVGILGASQGSTLTLTEDQNKFTEMLIVMSATEGTSQRFNYPVVVPKVAMTVGNANAFYVLYNYGASNTSYNNGYWIRERISYDPNQRKLTNLFVTIASWTYNGAYIYVR